MKRLLLLVFLLFSFSICANAQQTATQTKTFSTTESSSWMGLSTTATKLHSIQWWVFGTVSTCSLKLEKSATGTGAGTDLIGATTCTSNGSSTVTADKPNYVRITMSTLTGGGYVIVRYLGYNGESSGSGLTNTELRASPIDVNCPACASGGALTDTELRATPVPVSGTVTATGPLTDTQLRATPVPVSGTVTATTGGLTDTQLRATAVPVSGTVTATATDLDIRNLTATDVVTVTDGAGALNIICDSGCSGAGGLTDAELRATPVPVSGTVTVTDGAGAVNVIVDSSALPSGAATSAKQDTEIASLAAIDTDATTIIGHVDGLEALIGTTNTNTGGSATSLALLDDTVQVLGTDTYTEATSKGTTLGAVRRDADTALVGTTNEFGPLQMDALGRLKVEVFSGEALPVTLTSTTITGTVAATQSGTWDEVGINDSGNSITVDGTVTITDGAGAVNVIVDSITAGNNNIGDVDVASSALPTGASTLAEQQTQTTALQLIDNAISGAGFNITQQGGVAVSLNTGVRDTGTQRVTIATNDLVPTNMTQWATTALGTPTNFGTTPGAVVAGSVNASQFIGTVAAAAATNSLNSTGTGVPAAQAVGQCDATTPTALTENQFGNLRMDCATHDLGVVLPAETTKVLGTVRQVGNVGGVLDAAIGAAPPANAQIAAGLGSGATGGFLIAPPVCDSFYNVNMVTATTALWITGVSGRHVRICAITLVAAGADNVGIISGTGATCGTGSAAIVGTTAATGFNLSANGGIAHGSGMGTVMRTVAAGDSICGITSASVQLSGVISYTIY